MQSLYGRELLAGADCANAFAAVAANVKVSTADMTVFIEVTSGRCIRGELFWPIVGHVRITECEQLLRHGGCMIVRCFVLHKVGRSTPAPTETAP